MEDALTEDDIELIEDGDVSGVEQVDRRMAATLDVLRLLPAFAELPRSTHIELAKTATLVQHAAGAEVVLVGSRCPALYAILQGSAAVEVPSVLKEEPVVLGPGELFGESTLFVDEPSHATVRAQVELALLSIPKPSVDALVCAHPDLGEALLEMYVGRLVVNLMKTNPVFTALEMTARQDLAQLFETRKMAPGTVLIHENHPVDGMYIPLTGKLELSARGSSKQIRAGSVVGQGSLLTHANSRYSVATVGECVLLRLPAERFMDLITQFPPVLELLASRTVIEAD